MEFINTAEGKQEFIRSYFDRVRDKLIAEIPKMPEEWNGLELRWIISQIGAGELAHESVKRAGKNVRESDYYYSSEVI